jgi:hypothetical protein
MKLLAAIIFMLLPFTTFAADEPEAVYAKFHRAVMAGDLAEMLKYGPAQRRAEIEGMSASSKEAALKMAQFMMPRAFTLQRKTVQANGRAATLIVSGPWADVDQKLDTMYGTVRMLQENGEWKVDETSWSNDKPAILAAPKPAAAPVAAGKPAPKAAAPAVGSMQSASPGRTLGAAKPECIYKPVMTAQDMENCK